MDFIELFYRQTSDCQATLEVIGEQGERNISLGMPYVFERFYMTQLSDLYIGGIPDNIDYVNGAEPVANLIGCVGHMMWNDQPITLQNTIDAVSTKWSLDQS